MPGPSPDVYVLPPGSLLPGSYSVDVIGVTNSGSVLVGRQVCSFGDPNTWANQAAVSGAALVGTEFGLAVRNVVSAPNSAGATSQTAVGSSAVQITSATPAANRRTVRVKNTGGEPVYIGFANTVTVSTGYQIDSGEPDNFDVGPALTLFAIAGAVGGSVSVMEIG